MARSRLDELDVTGLELPDVIPMFARHLRARNLSAQTIKGYVTVTERFVRYLRSEGLPTGVRAIGQSEIEGYLEDLQASVAAGTVAKHYRHLQPIWRWLEDQGDIDANPMRRMKPPVVPDNPPNVLTDDVLKQLMKSTNGNSFENRRDAAIIRTFFDTGIRIGELVSLTVAHVDLDDGRLTVCGKGRRNRVVGMSPKTVDALGRYELLRRRHPHVRSDRWWLGPKGPLTDSGIRQMLNRRTRDAGLDHVKPHEFRHTYSHNWMLSGGESTDLMQQAGWASQQMVARYGRSAAVERALAAHARVTPGDRI